MSEIQNTLRVLRGQIEEFESKPKPVEMAPNEWVLEVSKVIPEIQDMCQPILDVVLISVEIDIGVPKKDERWAYDSTSFVIRMIMIEESLRMKKGKWDFCGIANYTKSKKRTKTRLATIKKQLQEHIEWVRAQGVQDQ